MDYPATLEFLYRQLPIFQRVGKAAYKADLNNTIALSAFFKGPHKHFRSVHIAGTNGKGSVAHMLASVFQEAGYKTGLYTSPHLKDFRERIKINGEMIPEKKVVEFVERAKPAIEKIQPSFFELTMMMAFEHFRSEEVDIAIIETGMGGRLDSTNIITPEISVITNIGMDHTTFLGKDLESIAHEKAGIIKQGIPVIIGRATRSVKKIFEDVASTRSAPILFAEQQEMPNVECDLKGIRQQANIRTSVAVIDLLKTQFPKIDNTAIAEGFTNIVRNTGLQGRWQTISKNPKVILDIAHNEDSIKALLANLDKVTFEDLHIVLGMVNDKEVSTLLSMLPQKAKYYFCKAKIPRGLEADLLAEKALVSHLSGSIHTNVQAAYKAAIECSKTKDLVLVTGSAFVVAEVL